MSSRLARLREDLNVKSIKLPPKNYETLKPTAIGDVRIESRHGVDRLYQITATIAPDGKATLVRELRKRSTVTLGV